VKDFPPKTPQYFYGAFRVGDRWKVVYVLLAGRKSLRMNQPEIIWIQGPIFGVLSQYQGERAWDNVSEMILRRSWYSLCAITDLVAFPFRTARLETCGFQVGAGCRVLCIPFNWKRHFYDPGTTARGIFAKMIAQYHVRSMGCNADRRNHRDAGRLA
jgi:hypothetical protein